MQDDLFGCAISLDDPAAVADWNRMVLAFLAHGSQTPTHLGAVLSGAPEFALGHAIKGLFTVMLGRREVMDTARDALATAQAVAAQGDVTPREAAYIAALSEWLGGRPSGTVAQMEAVLATHPGDALAMKVSHAAQFILGDSHGMRRSIEAVLPAYNADHPARGYLLGCHAFALEETGDYARAETAGRMGLGLAPDDAWGLHAVAHVHDMTGNARAGIDWLTGREPAWAHCNNFRYHVWWHKALMYLDLGQTDAALRLYDAEIRKDRTDDYRDISNATSLLSRLELDGVDVGNRWEELADLCETRTEDACLVFADMHYLLALIGDDRATAARRMLSRLHADAKRTGCEFSDRMAAPGVAAAAGLNAFGDGNYRTAFLNLRQARQTLQRAGGSHAQRDVFERLTIDAGLRAGLLDETETLLSDRTRRRGGFEDGYAAARHGLIAQARRNSAPTTRLPAE